MKQSKTTLKELTAAYRAVLRHGILCNAIALGLVAMPAMAQYTVTSENVNINEIQDIDLEHFGIMYNTNTGVLYAEGPNTGVLTGESINIGGTGEDAIGRAVQTRNGGKLVLGDANTKIINISAADGFGVLSLGNTGKTQGSIIKIKGESVNVSVNKGTAIHVGNNTFREDATNQAYIDIDANNIDVYSGGTGLAAMSEGTITIKGNAKINAIDEAIVARGDAKVIINKDTDHTLKMDGNIAFDYDKATSGTKVDAIVDITLNGAESYWTGNTIASHGTGHAPDDSYMKVDSVTLTMKDGATWNATKIEDNTEDDKVGSWYVAMNNLNINKGTVNIADTTRGINVENVNVADATFNGGPLNIGTMNLTGGESVFNTNIIGLNDESSLDVKSGASMDIGTNSINVNTITLNGDMFATLRDGEDAQITTSKFDGNGKLNLTMSKAGKYHVFGKKDFENILSANAVYELSALDGGYIEATVKSTEAIAGDTHIAHESAAAVSHIASAASVSESKQLQELSLKLQEKLANGDTASVEHATKAVHPETESVAQSVSSSVQNTVVNVAASRMALPTVGRSAGDVNLTSGGVWAQGLFNKSKQNDAFHGYTRGIAAGLDGTINKVWTIGAGYSFAHSDITGSARDTEIDSNTLFLYGQYKPSEWYVNAVANYTWSDYSEKGSVIDDALVSANYDVQSFGGHIATGYDFDNGITPELGLRYMHVNADDYTNSYGIKTSMKDTDFLTGVVGAKYAFNIVAGKHTTFAPQLSANAKYDMLSDKSVATIAMPGVDAYTIDGNRLNRFGGEFGIGLGMTYDNLHMSINYDIDVRKDYTSQTGMLKFRYN